MILGIWASHHLMPTPWLEKLAIPEAQIPVRLHSLRAVPGVDESFVLSTCNRVELYVSLDEATTPEAVTPALIELLAGQVDRAGIDPDGLRERLVIGVEEEAARHLFSVACGLESMVVGEYQIVAQIREALRLAETEQTVGPAVGDLVKAAIQTSKKVRTGTGIGSAGTSMVSVGLDWAAQLLGGLRGRSALLIGSGRMSQLAGSLLGSAGVSSVSVANRTRSHADRLAGQLGARAIDLDQLTDGVAQADVVVSSTGSPDHLLSHEQVARALARRPGRPLFVLDLAVPRDVDPVAGDLAGVTLISVLELGERLRETGGTDDVGLARAIVAERVEAYLRRRRESQIAPLIIALRSTASGLVESELRRLHDRLPHLDLRARQETDAAMRRAMGKLIHTPTVRVKELAATPGGSMYSEALAVLFDLDGRADS